MGSFIKTSKSVDDYLADLTINKAIPFNIIHDEVDAYIDDAWFNYLLEPLVRTLEIRGLMDVVGYKFLKVKFDVEFVKDGLADGAFFATESVDLYKSLYEQAIAKFKSGDTDTTPTATEAIDVIQDTESIVQLSFESQDKLLAFVIRSEALSISKPHQSLTTVTLAFGGDSFSKELPLSFEQIQSLYDSL